MRSARIILSLGLVTGISSAALAEVGVARPSGSGTPAVQSYIFVGISEDPNPIGGIWAPVSPTLPERRTLNPLGTANGDGPPSIAVSLSPASATVAWARNSASGFDVVISRFDGTDWSPAQVVVGDPSVNELDPQIVIGSDGTVHLFYWVDGPSPRVFYTSAPAGLTAWSTPAPVSPSGQVTCRPAGAFFGGVLRVVYEVHEFGYGNSPRQIVIARFEGGEFVTEVVAPTNHTGEVRPQVHSHGGKLWVDWIDAETSGHSGELAWTRLSAQGQWEPISYQAFDDVEQREFLVRGGARMLAIQP